MEANLQRCNVCKKVNTEESADWVRIGGAGTGSRRPNPVMLDFCPDCAAKTPVKDTVALMPAVPPPPGRPALVANPPTPPA